MSNEYRQGYCYQSSNGLRHMFALRSTGHSWSLGCCELLINQWFVFNTVTTVTYPRSKTVPLSYPITPDRQQGTTRLKRDSWSKICSQSEQTEKKK